MKGWGIPKGLTEDEIMTWALGEIAAKRGVKLVETPEWGMTLVRCIGCGFLHVNVIRTQFECARCGRFQGLGDTPDPLPEAVDHWLRLQERRCRVYIWKKSTGLGMIHACTFCHFVMVNMAYEDLGLCPLCERGYFRDHLRETPSLMARGRAWGWWRIWGTRHHLQPPE